jgi:hypothetical protein
MLSIINDHPIFILIAFIVSFWTTINVPSIHVVKSWHEFVVPQLIHQFFLNLSGSVVGWGALYYILYIRPTGPLTLIDLVLGLIAYVGILAYLPHLIINKGFRPN